MTSISVTLGIEKTFDLRRLLSQNGFVMLLKDKITCTYSLIKEDYASEERVPLETIGRTNDFVYICLYNDKNVPSQCIFKALELGASQRIVHEYTLKHVSDQN